MRRLLLFALVVALAVPPLFGNVIVKRQADDEGENNDGRIGDDDGETFGRCVCLNTAKGLSNRVIF